MLFIVIISIAFVGFQNVGANETNRMWAALSVPNPPTIIDDNSNFTLIYDQYGQVTKVPFVKDLKTTTPKFSAERDVRFELFTSKNPDEAQVLLLGNSATVEYSNFNPKNPTRIVIHGWHTKGTLTGRFAKAYFAEGKHEVNFIALNWQKGAQTPNYLSARNRVPEVGKHLSNFIDFLAEKHKLDFKDLTIIGHSLGAHVAGICGKSVTKGKLSKIVGLDPAGPLFSIKEPEGRLDATDATYVEVIHTCAGLLGMSKPIGTASFYPNGGRSQPGCKKWDVVGLCDHRRSYLYYLESIVRPRFLAFECDSYENLKNKNCSVTTKLVQMGGEPGNKHLEGIFYLDTNPEPLYSKEGLGVISTLIDSKESKPSKMSDLPWKLINLVKSKLKRYEVIEPEISGEEPTIDAINS